MRLLDPGKFPTSEQGVGTWPLGAANESSSPGPVNDLPQPRALIKARPDLIAYPEPYEGSFAPTNKSLSL